MKGSVRAGSGWHHPGWDIKHLAPSRGSWSMRAGCSGAFPQAHCCCIFLLFYLFLYSDSSQFAGTSPAALLGRDAL